MSLEVVFTFQIEVIDVLIDVSTSRQSLPAMSLVKKDDHEQFKTADKV